MRGEVDGFNGNEMQMVCVVMAAGAHTNSVHGAYQYGLGTPIQRRVLPRPPGFR